jgi:hypothetical protein
MLLTSKALLLVALFPLAPLFAPGRASDGVRRERLPADVDMVLHLDLEAFKATELWQRVSQRIEEHDELELELEELAEIEERFGIDPLTDVRALTLFKVEKEEDPTVVLFSTSEKVDEALRRFQKEPGYARVIESGIEFHTWREGDGGDDTAFAYVHAAGSSERVVALASGLASALRAARVLRGDDPSHAVSGTLLTLAPAKGSFLYLAAAEIPHLDEITPASQVIGLAQGIQLDLGEAGGFLRGHMGLTTGSPEDAFNIANVINGLVSLARLAGQELGEALELLTGLRINTHRSEVTLDFEYDVARLFEILESVGGFRMDGGDER